MVGEDAAASLAIVAIDDEDEALAAVARLKARGVLVNAVDRPDLCDFTLPAIVDRDPVLVAIGTGGASAGLAAALRQRLETLLPATLGQLARDLYDAWHDFAAVHPSGARMTANIAGPVCETGDTFAMGRDIDLVSSDDLAVFRSAGAYGATMASTYNSRALVPEVLVDGDRYAVVADRIHPETILAAERVPEWLKPE